MEATAPIVILTLHWVFKWLALLYEIPWVDRANCCPFEMGERDIGPDQLDTGLEMG